MSLTNPSLALRANKTALVVPSHSPIRVSFLIDNLSRAGTESQLLALLRNLDRRVIEPSLVLLNGEGDESRALEPDNCEVIRLGVTRLLGAHSFLAARRLHRYWRETRPDIVQAYFMDSAYYGVPVAKAAGVRKIVRVRNNLGYWLTHKHRMLGRVLRPWVDIVLTNTDAGREQLVANEGLAANRVAVIENGVDLERFPVISALPNQSITIGCVANLREVKNIDGFMRAAKIVCDRFPDVLFEVAGDGELRPNLEHLRTKLDLTDRFLLRGSVADVPGFLSSLSIAVLPSHSEGMSNALLEYMAAGRAIVATDVGANATLIHHEVHGLIVPPRDDAALASAIMRLVSDAMLAHRLGVTARSRVEQEYSRAAMCRRFEAFYRQLAGRQ